MVVVVVVVVVGGPAHLLLRGWNRRAFDPLSARL